MKLIADVATNEWSLVSDVEEPDGLVIYVGFTDLGNLPVAFDGLSYGVSVLDKGRVIFESDKPLAGTVYESTDQQFLDYFLIPNVKAGFSYSVHVWAENAGIKWADDFSVTLPKPEQPYLSWSYDKVLGVWVAPKPHPDDDYVYSWDEESVSWIPVSDQQQPGEDAALSEALDEL